MCELAKNHLLTKKRLSAMTTESAAQMPANETSKTWKSTGVDKRKGRKAAVALANTPGVVEEIINGMLKKGDGDGKCRGRSPGKGQGKARQGQWIKRQRAAPEEQIHME